GIACTTDLYASDLPAGAIIVYVAPGVGAGGNGSDVQPYATIAAALADARSRTPGAIIALGQGTLTEQVTLPAGVTLWGACMNATLRSPGATGVTVTVAGAGVTIKNL